MEKGDFSAYHPGNVLSRAVERGLQSAKDGVNETTRNADIHLNGRALTEGELREIRWMFGAIPGIERARIFPHNFWWPYPNDRAMTPNGHIYFPSQDFRDDFSLASVPLKLRALFMHEATHLYQWYKLGKWVWVRGPFDRKYDYDLKVGQPLRNYRLEQMGQIVQDYYNLRHGTRLVGRYYSLHQYADALPVRR